MIFMHMGSVDTKKSCITLVSYSTIIPKADGTWGHAGFVVSTVVPTKCPASSSFKTSEVAMPCLKSQTLHSLCELQSKLLVSPLITRIVVPYILPYITPLEEFRLQYMSPG